MRRVSSVILFVLGGFCVGMQVMIGFLNVPPNYPRAVPPILYFSAIAALFLVPATLVSPGRRWRELGMTMLIGAAVCVGSFAITITATPEEGGTGGLGPLEGYVDWTQGWVNVAAIAIVGAVLLFVEAGERA